MSGRARKCNFYGNNHNHHHHHQQKKSFKKQQNRNKTSIQLKLKNIKFDRGTKDFQPTNLEVTKINIKNKEKGKKIFSELLRKKTCYGKNIPKKKYTLLRSRCSATRDKKERVFR